MSGSWKEEHEFSRWKRGPGTKSTHTGDMARAKLHKAHILGFIKETRTLTQKVMYFLIEKKERERREGSEGRREWKRRGQKMPFDARYIFASTYLLC